MLGRAQLAAIGSVLTHSLIVLPLMIGVSTQFGTDDMKIFAPSLALREIEDRHTIENISDMLKEIVSSWGIVPSLVVSDNASNALGSSESLANYSNNIIGFSPATSPSLPFH